MKVVLINGSNRKSGNTEIALDYLKSKLDSESVNVEIVNLSQYNISHCTVCDYCKNDERCCQADDFNEVFEKMKNSQVIITATPVYCGLPTSLILALLQRAAYINFYNKHLFDGKYGASIAIGGESGQVNSISALSHFYLVNDMYIVGSKYWNIGFASKKGEIEKDINFKSNMDNLSTRIKEIENLNPFNK